ncbi:SDR family oxidoreductase [Streptomyces sp. SP18BB07]|uniref:SDR family oxidoreductase n=1 Tax=Streptomyces sp. SP18BB07 TaxID=3002522 RepID=UPI002E7807CD|nr:hypothetical protein [Streptomyces sp. SP18BB07]
MKLPPPVSGGGSFGLLSASRRDCPGCRSDASSPTPVRQCRKRTTEPRAPEPHLEDGGRHRRRPRHRTGHRTDDAQGARSLDLDLPSTVRVTRAALGKSLVQQLPQALDITSKRVSEPDEVAALIAFLLSDAVGNILGAEYVIDGGMLKTL